jgi:methionyl-tRNA synthetase
VQFMAKDNVPFHTIGFPGMILGSGEPWKLVDYLKAFNWLTYYGGKFSTSRGVGVFMDDALELLAPDYWRYYLMANAPESDDTSFTWETFAVAVNKDLADTFGNFVNRSLTLSQRRFGPEIPAGGTTGEEERLLAADIDEGLREYTALLESLEFRKAMGRLRALWSRGNAYFDRKQPWAAVKSDPADAALSLRTSINLTALFARLSAPVMPSTADAVLEALHVDDRGWPDHFDASALPAGRPFEVPPVLFRKISDADIATWSERFGDGSAAVSREPSPTAPPP